MLKEEEIRPEALKKAQAEAYRRDVARLYEKRGEFVRVPCPSCGVNMGVPHFEKDGFSYEHCIRCQMVFMNPRPNQETLAWHYRGAENGAFWADKIFPASESARLEKIVRPRVDQLFALCRRYGVVGERLVEIGAGFGTFCAEVARQRLFREVVAIEPTPSFAEACREKALLTVEAPIEACDVATADVVVSFEVIEHVFSPRAFVRSAARALKEGGLLILTCPNIAGFETMMLGARSTTVDIEHLNYFTPESLSALVQSEGLEVCEATTPGHLDAELVKKQWIPGGHAFFDHLFGDGWASGGAAFQRFLRDAKLSSHMRLVARKPA